VGGRRARDRHGSSSIPGSTGRATGSIQARDALAGVSGRVSPAGGGGRRGTSSGAPARLGGQGRSAAARGARAGARGNPAPRGGQRISGDLRGSDRRHAAEGRGEPSGSADRDHGRRAVARPAPAAESVIEDPELGQAVTTAGSVRPSQFAGQSGVVVEMNGRDGEIGVRLGSALSHTPAIWFRHHELERRNPQSGPK
jgi:hypothetical protein